MSKYSSVFHLVHSLSKAEKRYFKLYSSLQKEAKEYYRLYTAIEKATDMEEVKKKYTAQNKTALFEANCKYLYKVIINALLQFTKDTDKTSRLINATLKARILFQRSMYDEGFSLLEKTKTEAAKNEEFIIELWAVQMELYYLSILGYHNISEKQLIQKQMKIDELLKYHKNIHQQTSLYESLRHRLLYKGTVRTKEQKDELNDLVVSELNYNSNPLANTFESDRIHLLFQSYYFIAINDATSALKTLHELNNLMQNHKQLWIERPIDYLGTVEGVLESLLSTKEHTEFQPFINTLQSLEIKSAYFEVMLERVRFIYGIAGFLNNGEFEKAEAEKKKYEHSLFKKMHLLDPYKQAEVYLYSAIIFIGKGDMNKAHKELNKVLLEKKAYYHLPFYRTFRLLHLLVHYELGNHDYIEYEIRSLKRTLKKEYKKSYLVERIVFRFLQQQPLPSSLKAREIIWKKFREGFIKLSADKYESQLLRIFDFATWIEAKLLKKSFEAITNEKFINKVTHIQKS